MVTATVNPMLMNTGSQYSWSNIFNVIQKSCGVQCQVSAYGILLAGTLSQIAKAGDILDLRWKKHCQSLKLQNVQDHNSFNQYGMISNQADKKDNIHATSFNQSDTTFHQHNMSGPGFNLEYEQYGTINQHPSTSNQYNNVNSMGPNTSREPFLEARSQNQFYQQNVSYTPGQGHQQLEGNLSRK